MKYIVTMKESKIVWEFPTKETRDGFIKKFKVEEYTTDEIDGDC